MSMTAAILVLLLGIVIGYWLRTISNTLQIKYRRTVYKPAVLRRISIDTEPEVNEQ